MNENINKKIKKIAAYGVRYSYRKLLNNFVDRITFIHPDLMSFMAFFVAVATGILYYKSGEIPVFLLVNIGLIFLGITFNILAELLLMNRSKFTIINEIIYTLPDRYADLFVLIGISFSSLCDIRIGMIATVTIFLISYTGILGKALGVSWQHQGPLDKTNRLVILMAASFLQFPLSKAGTPTVSIWGFDLTIIELCMVLFMILGQLTVLMRISGILEDVKKVDRVLYRGKKPEE
jgi:archaetidylinositol phosphate synthase